MIGFLVNSGSYRYPLSTYGAEPPELMSAGNGVATCSAGRRAAEGSDSPRTASALLGRSGALRRTSNGGHFCTELLSPGVSSSHSCSRSCEFVST